MVKHNPYKDTSDEILFNCYATKKDLAESEVEREKETSFSKGQPCSRLSQLGKRYGWGIHSNEEGKIACIEWKLRSMKSTSKTKA